MAEIESPDYWSDAKQVDVQSPDYWQDAQVMDAPANTVFDQSKGRTVAMPQTLNATETDFVIKRDVDEVKNFFAMEDVGGFTALGNGIKAFFAAQPQAFGALGKAATERKGGLLAGIPEGIERTPLGLALDAPIKAMADKFEEWFPATEVKTSDFQGIIDRNKKYMADAGLERPEQGGFAGVMYDLGNGVSSMLASLGIAAFTRSPSTAALYFGALQKASVYEEARVSGATPEAADNISTVAGIVEGGLEKVGLDYFLKALKGNSYVKRFISGFAIEAIQEGSQAAGEEAITQVSGTRKKELSDTAQDILYQAVIGGVIGGGSNASVGLFVKDKAKEAGLDEKTASAMASYAEKNVDAAKTNLGEFIQKELAPIAKDEKSAMEFMTLMQKFGNNQDLVQREQLDPETRAVFDQYIEMFNASVTDKGGIQDVEKSFYDMAVKAGVAEDEAVTASKLVGARADAASRALGISPMQWLESKKLSIQVEGKESPEIKEAQEIKNTLAQKQEKRINRNDAYSVQKGLGLSDRPLSVLQYIKKLGGIHIGLTNEEQNNVKKARAQKGMSASKYAMASGELRRIFENKKAVLGGLINDRGLGLDELHRSLVNAGYLEKQETAQDESNPDEVLDLIEREANGTKVYQLEIDRQIDAVSEGEMTNSEFYDYLGITPDMSVQEIAGILERYRQEGVNKSGADTLAQEDDILFQSKDYMITHRPPSPSSGAPAYDLTGDGQVYPDDVYSDKAVQYYGHGNRSIDAATIKTLQALRGKPNAKVKIYRASEKGVPSEINSGDWVTVNKKYAEEHGQRFDNGFQIVEMEVSANEIFTNGDSIHEFGYFKDGKETLEQSAKGSASFSKEGILIQLFKGSDASTLLHELGHMFLRDMRDVAKTTKRPMVKKDYEAVKKFLGATGDTLTVAQEEKFARAFEAYLREGRAPKPELQTVFDKFKQWLTDIYKSVKELNVQINPEIRKTLDRMLGSDYAMAEKLDQAEQERNIEADYDAVANVEQPNTFWQDTGKVFKSISDLSADAFVPVSTRLGNIDQALKHAVRKFVFKTGLYTHQDRVAIQPFVEAVSNKMTEQDYRILDLALKNRDMVKVEFMMDKYGLQAEWQAVRDVLDNLFNQAQDVGMEVGYIEDYFPRKVKRDKVIDYLNAIRKTELWTEVQLAMKDVDPNGAFTPEEQSEFVNNYLRGFNSSRINLARPSYTKERRVDYVTPEFNQYYEDSMPTLINYVTNFRSVIEGKKLFGKSEQDTEENIGSYVLGLIEQGIVKKEQEDEIKKLLRAVVVPTGTTGAVSWSKNAAYVYVMGNPISAITQIQDLAFSLHKNGYWRTAKSLAKSLTGNQAIKKEDIGIDNILQEFEDETRASKFVRATFKAVGLNFMDNIGKETYLEASLGRLQEQARKNSPEFQQFMTDIFGAEAASAKADLLAGTMSENVKYMLFSEISDVQPISLAEMPVGYLRGGNGRVFYMLKTYTIKQLDIYRREIFANLASGEADKVALGLRNLVGLGISLMLLGMSSDALKDLILGRNIEIDDLVTDNLLKLLGFTKYQIYKAKAEGVGSAILRTLFMPPVFALPDDAIKDVGNIVVGKTDARTGKTVRKPAKESEVLGHVPFVGKMYYWWWGGGAAKEEKAKKKKKPTTP